MKDGILITPTEEVLGGITSKVVLEIAKKEGIKIEERRVFQSELQTADEVFITSSFKDIVPVAKIDGFTVGDGKVGPVTKDLIHKFEALTEI